jgi:hypothetical protein
MVYLSCVLPLEKVHSLLVIFGFDVASRNHSFYQRLRCSGEALCLWMGDNGATLSMVKRAHLHYSNIYIPGHRQIETN